MVRREVLVGALERLPAVLVSCRIAAAAGNAVVEDFPVQEFALVGRLEVDGDT